MKYTRVHENDLTAHGYLEVLRERDRGDRRGVRRERHLREGRAVISLAPFSLVWRIPVGTENDSAKWHFAQLAWGTPERAYSASIAATRARS
jgi:hypothetical protein